MKFTRSLLIVAAAILLPFVYAKHGFWITFLLANLAFGAWLMPRAELGTATLITNILTGKIIAPLRTNVPELDFFSVDWGRTGGEFAPPAKWNQEVISHMIAAPTAEAFTPGSGLGSNTQNPKDLLSDVKVKIDKAAKVSLKMPVTDAVAYFLNPAFKETLTQASISLGRYVLGVAVAKFGKPQFSQEAVATVAGVEIESIGDVRAQMNKLGSLAPRFILGETNWVKQLSRDPVIQSGDYHGQLTTDDPYVTLVNIEGFSKIREFPNMPTNTTTLGTCTVVAATNVITVSAAHGLAVNDRVRFTSATTLPAGLEADKDYYVLTVPSSTTLTVSRTISGSVVDITDTGTGTHTIYRYEGINALAFEKRAVHICFRQLLDNDELADMLGIPKTNKKMVVTDNETGVTVTWYFWQDNTGTNPTGDVFATAVVAFGVRAGRELVDPDSPVTQAAGSGMDYGAVRIVEKAAA